MPAALIDRFDQLTLRYMTVEQSSQVARRFPDAGVIGIYSATSAGRALGCPTPKAIQLAGLTGLPSTRSPGAQEAREATTEDKDGTSIHRLSAVRS